MRAVKVANGEAGTVLGGKYRVERVLGKGGAGIVVAAVHRELRQRVAIKLLRGDADAEQEERFLREARATVRLQGDHVARVTDVGRQPDGAPYLVMEMLHGEDLGHLVERGRLPFALAVDYVLQACEGLAEAHALGIVHRDVKPGNLFLARQPNGRSIVKVLDFGIAKANTLAPGAHSLTATSTVVGTPHYMSPEQARESKDVDARADIWSLGVSLYELVSGRAPFDGSSVADVFARIFTAAPAPLTAIRGVPEELWRTVERCLAKTAAGRPSDVAELAAALEPFGSEVSRGAAARVRAVLHAAPQFASTALSPDSCEGNTRTVAISESAGRRAPGSLRIALGAAGGLAVVVGAMLGLHGLRDVPTIGSRAAATGVPASTVFVASPPPAVAPTVAVVDASGGWTEVPALDAGAPGHVATARASAARPAGRPSAHPPRHGGGRSPSKFF